MTRWSDKARRVELDLFQKKWWDYRQSHPVVATYLFAFLFTQETRRIIRAHIDPTPPRVTATGRVIDWNPIKDGDVFEPPHTRSDKTLNFWVRKIGSLIKARQFADQHGIPYQVAVKTGLKHWYFGRSYFLEQMALPEPGMLNGKECQEAILLGWGEALDARIQVAEHPRYKRLDDPHPDIAKHQAWICDQISRKTDPTHAIRKFVRQGVLSRELAETRYGSQRVARALV